MMISIAIWAAIIAVNYLRSEDRVGDDQWLSITVLCIVAFLLVDIRKQLALLIRRVK